MLLLCKPNEEIIFNSHLVTGVIVTNHYKTAELTIESKMSVQVCMADAHMTKHVMKARVFKFHTIMRLLHGPSHITRKEPDYAGSSA